MNKNCYAFDRIACPLWDFRSKGESLRSYVKYMLARTQRMFEYDGLPDTIPARIFELYMQVNGYVGVIAHEDDIYAVWGGLGGEPDYNYMPTKFTVANPALNMSKVYDISNDCVIIPNDSMYQGLMPMLRKYGTALTENELSMNLVSINTRIQSLIAASDDRTKESAMLYLKHVIDGDIGVIADLQMFENLKTLDYGTSGRTGEIKSLIEYEQYLKASCFNELGLDANYNMKRETLTDSENEMNRDSLRPLIDDMLTCRQEGIRQVNNMFGLNISVKLSSAWKDNATEVDLAHAIMKAEADQVIENQDSQEDDQTETEVIDDESADDTE